MRPKNFDAPPEKILLRLPPGLREQMKAAAKMSNRTMTAEIIHRLEVSLLDTALPASPSPAFIRRWENVLWVEELSRLVEAILDRGAIYNWPIKVEALCESIMSTLNVDQKLLDLASAALFWLHQTESPTRSIQDSPNMSRANMVLYSIATVIERRVDALKKKYFEQTDVAGDK